jgi:1,4-dihydroxy-2-naphthoyl-CoA hydrolase
MHTYRTTIKLHDTDAAGMLFFSNQLKIAHDAYESLFDRIGFCLSKIVHKEKFLLPIVHSETDYKAPLFVGDPIEIRTTVAHVGTTSFTLAYTILNDKKEIVGAVKTVHVSVNKQTRKKIPLPAALRAKLKKLCVKLP